MSDGNVAFNLLLLGQKSDLQLMGRNAAEPWNEKPGRQAARARKKVGSEARLNRSLEQAASGACCCET